MEKIEKLISGVGVGGNYFLELESKYLPKSIEQKDRDILFYSKFEKCEISGFRVTLMSEFVHNVPFLACLHQIF